MMLIAVRMVVAMNVGDTRCRTATPRAPAGRARSTFIAAYALGSAAGKVPAAIHCICVVAAAAACEGGRGLVAAVVVLIDYARTRGAADVSYEHCRRSAAEIENDDIVIVRIITIAAKAVVV